jgi:hypothetical protein
MEEPWLQNAHGDVYLNRKGWTAAFFGLRAGRTPITSFNGRGYGYTKRQSARH